MKKLTPLLLSIAVTSPVYGSTAYGDLNNFDTVNDTGQECHGFEIEIDDVHSTDITYTYDWNHYGAPKITEDNSDSAHPKVFIRYAAAPKPDGTWSAYTAVPAAPLAPTDGHRCTNPAVNEGCEHFGVGYYGAPSAVKYNWLVDDGAGNLIHGPAVNIATPSFVYYPPVVGPGNPQPAQVQAAIALPPPPEPPVLEFGDAVWVKEIKTTSHNSGVVELKDLVSDDPDDPDDKNWKNGEPDEIEVEWRILQTEFAKPGEGNGELQGAPEELPEGDEVVTRRYEFFKYVGPLDAESGEALCDNVDPDTLLGANDKPECSGQTVIGDYIGAQMAGFNVEAVLGLIDHLQDGEIYIPYVDRTVVVGGNTPYAVTVTEGVLPTGLALDPDTGILSGTPTQGGVFPFTVQAADADNVVVAKAFTLKVIEPLAISTSALPGATEAAPYSLTLTAAGGSAPYAWSSDPLPSGLTLSSAGVISGTPDAGSAGSYTPNFTVTDAGGDVASAALTLTVAAAPAADALSFNTSSLPNAKVKKPYRADIKVIGGARPYVWTVTGLPSALKSNHPKGKKLHFSGKPQVAGVYEISVSVMDSQGDTAHHTFALTVE